MIRSDPAFESECAELMRYLYTTAAYKCRDCEDIDILVSECMYAFLLKHARGEQIEHPKAYLDRVLMNQYNEALRRKYRNRISSYEDMRLADETEPSDTVVDEEEYASVRLLLGRLTRIYREVAVRYYVKGESVDEIAEALGIPRGTVLSRLSNARGQIKEGMTDVEKYSQYSYAPKHASIGIWGSAGLSGEPFTLLSSPVEKNILILAYEVPVSVRGLADTMGMPAAYIEPAVEKLVEGELLGRTPGGLVYTRCYVESYEDSFGDITAQEALAEKNAACVWEIVWKHLAPLTERPAFTEMSEKQKATMLLFIILRSLQKVKMWTRPKKAKDLTDAALPIRPNGGKWMATLTYRENGQKRDNLYEQSGPLMTTYCPDKEKRAVCQMFDFQSLFGDAHHAYGDLKYNVDQQSIMRFFASLLPCDVKTENSLVYELIPDFENLHILRRDEKGEIVLDIPALPWREVDVWTPVTAAMDKELFDTFRDDVWNLWHSRKHRVPKHVDGAEHYQHEGATSVYPVAQLVAIVKQGLLPYRVEIGKTPLIYLAYKHRDEAGDAK